MPTSSATLLPSVLTLCGFLLPAAILLLRTKPRSAGLVVQVLLIALFCMFGGLMFSAAAIALSGGIEAPLLTSTLVIVGALLCLAGQQWWQSRGSSSRR